MTFQEKLTNRQTLFAKVESTYGVDATPTAGDALMMLSGTNITPNSEAVSNDRISSSLSPVPHVNGKIASGYTGRHELRGGGATAQAVSIPETDALLRACGMGCTAISFIPTAASPTGFTLGETVNGADSSASGKLLAVVDTSNVKGCILTDINNSFNADEDLTGADSSATSTAAGAAFTGWRYAPVSDPSAMSSVTLYSFMDGHRHSIPGARGTFSLELPNGAPGILNFTLSGRYVRPAEMSQPVPDIDPTLPPLATNIGLCLGNYEPQGVTSVSFDLANNVVRDEDINAPDGVRGFSITSRRPTGSLDPKADSLSNMNPFELWETGVSARIQALVGTAPGNRILVIAPAAQHSDAPAYADRDGHQSYSLSFVLNGDKGDDEFQLLYF